jgi:hypothetical protein
MNARFVSGAFAIAALAACGGDDGGGGIKVPDANTTPTPDSPAQATCYAMPDYGTPTKMSEGVLRLCATQTAIVKCPATTTTGTTGTATDPVLVAYFAQINAQNDFFNFELWKTSMTMPVAPVANVNLGDATNSQWKTCAACAYVSAQVDLQSGMDKGTYLAKAGTANVTTVTLNATAANTKFAGSVTAVDMQHVDIAMDGTSTPSADACTTKVAAVMFDRAMADPMMMIVNDKTTEQFENAIIARLNAKYFGRR